MVSGQTSWSQRRSVRSVSFGCSPAAAARHPSPQSQPRRVSHRAPEAPAPAEEESSASSEKKDGAKDDEESGESASKESAKPTRSAKDILTTEGMLFSFSFRDSDVYEKADKECADKSGGDPQKKADCMTKAGASVEADSMIFKKETDGKWTWIPFAVPDPRSRC